MTIVFASLLISELFFHEEAAKILYPLGRAAATTVEARSSSIGGWAFLFSLPLFLFVLFLPKAMRLLRIDRPLGRTLVLTIAFAIVSTIAWALAGSEFSYLVYFLIYGGFLGVIEGVYEVPVYPEFLERGDLSIEGKREMIRFEVDKWWKALNLAWIVIVAIVVSGVITWITSSPAPQGRLSDEQLAKLANLQVKKLFFLIFPSIPAIAMLFWNVIKRTNHLHEELGKLYKK